MRTTLSPARGRAILLYSGVAVFVLLSALTARTLWRAWNERAGQARTAAVFELVQQRMPSRPIEAPGAIAWLREQLTTYRAHLRGSDASTFERLSDETENVPAELVAATKPCAPSCCRHRKTTPCLRRALRRISARRAARSPC